jgi:hypothetical protein
MTKSEIYFTAFVLLIIGSLGYFNLQNSQVLARDIQRKNDLKHIAAALNTYLRDEGEYPISQNGKILACKKNDKIETCEWGQDPLESTRSAYIKPMPEDPLSPSGKYDYFYISNTKNFQIYASLEREEDTEYNKDIVGKNLVCGVHICNFGVASAGTSLTEELPMFKKINENE